MSIIYGKVIFSGKQSTDVGDVISFWPRDFILSTNIAIPGFFEKLRLRWKETDAGFNELEGNQIAFSGSQVLIYDVCES